MKSLKYLLMSISLVYSVSLKSQSHNTIDVNKPIIKGHERLLSMDDTSYSYASESNRMYKEVLKSFKPLSFQTKINDSNVYKNNPYQIFYSSGFKIKCGCSLYENNVFKKMAKENGVNNVINAYVCAENRDDPYSAAIYNIVIYNESRLYRNKQPSQYSNLEKLYIVDYVSKLNNNNINHKVIDYKNVKAVQYEFSQMGMPTKALFFIKNKKSYLIQVGTRSNLNLKFNQMKNSFKIL